MHIRRPKWQCRGREANEKSVVTSESMFSYASLAGDASKANDIESAWRPQLLVDTKVKGWSPGPLRPVSSVISQNSTLMKYHIRRAVACRKRRISSTGLRHMPMSLPPQRAMLGMLVITMAGTTTVALTRDCQMPQSCAVSKTPRRPGSARRDKHACLTQTSTPQRVAARTAATGPPRAAGTSFRRRAPLSAVEA